MLVFAAYAGFRRHLWDNSLVRPWENSHYPARGLIASFGRQTPKRSPGMSTNQLLAAMDEVLEQGEALLMGLSDAQYADAENLRASVGAHYRHSLEHFQLLLEAVNGPEIDYDRRERDAGLEQERLFALQMTRDFRHAARFLSALNPDRPIQAQYKISYAGSGACSASSTVGREIMYAVSHAIHHYALIGMICDLRVLPVPQDFGVAPSTIAYQKTTARRSA
jgi:hypothetical protein